MTDKNHKELRVVCLCGQKMRVTPEMYGRPAKCVACHLKWFVPDKYEALGAARHVYLAAHPQLLRRPGQFQRYPAESVAEKGHAPVSSATFQPVTGLDVTRLSKVEYIPDAEEVETLIPEKDGQKKSASQDNDSGGRASDSQEDGTGARPVQVPLDLLEPLRLLCGYRAELRRRIQAAVDGGEMDSCGPVLDAYERALQRTWVKLADRLATHQRDTETQLRDVDEDIVRLNVSLRAGELDLRQYLTRVSDLRTRRESLRRHHHNLMAWRNVNEPNMAGGTADVTLESFDEYAFHIDIPEPVKPPPDTPLFLVFGNELRDALRMRSTLERRKAAWEIMAAEKNFPAMTVQEGTAETEAALTRNTALMRFCRERLEQLLFDCTNDLKVTNAYKSDMVARWEREGANQRQRRDTLAYIQQVETVLMREKELIRKTLSANASPEVPEATSTLVKRLGGAIGKRRTSVDAPFLLIAAMLIIIGLLLFSDTGRSGVDEFGLLLTCGIICIATSSALVNHIVRGPVIALAWAIQLALLAYFLFLRAAGDVYLLEVVEEDYFCPVRVSSVRAWVLVVGAACAGVGVGIAAGNGLRRWGLARTLVVILILLCAIFSGAFIAFAHTIAPRTAPLTFDLYSEVDGAVDRTISTDAREDETLVEVEAEESEEAREPLDNDKQPEEFRDGEQGEAPLSENKGPVVPMILFAMQGVVHGEDTEPRFRGTLNYPDGRVESLVFRLGDEIVGPWKAQEYNRDTKKLVISNEERLLILQAGDRLPLAPVDFVAP